MLDIFKKYNITPRGKPTFSIADEDGHIINKNVITSKFIHNLDNKIRLMHELGYAHGDLSIHNIVYDDLYEPYIINFDNAYKINNHTWKTELWMRQGYEWHESYKNFVNFDYIHWKTGLNINNSPTDEINMREEYYDIRFTLIEIDNYNFVQYLQCYLGGNIYNVKNINYILLTPNGKFIDSTGVYKNKISMISVLKSRFNTDNLTIHIINNDLKCLLDDIHMNNYVKKIIKRIKLRNYPVLDIKIPYNTEFGNHINFNPSIVHLKNNYYLVSFHSFRRNEGHSEFSSVKSDINDPYHLYYGGPESKTWWNPGREGEWGTGFMLINMSNYKIKSIDIVDYLDRYLDTRLLKTSNKIIATTSNGEKVNSLRGIDRSEYQLDKYIYPDNTMLTTSNIFSITTVFDQGEFIFKMNEPQPLCIGLQHEEKNWSPYIFNDQLYISNWLVPKHIVFIPHTYEKCSVIKSQHQTIFNKIEKFYEHKVLFSLSTPAISYNNVKLAVGHLKIDGNVKMNTLAYQFIQNDKPKHPFNNYSYMMFLYTFDPETLEILSLSPAFYPPTTQHAVVFPVGLTYNQDYIVSYGEADMKMKLIFISPDNLINLLVPTSDYDEEYEFIQL